MVRGKCYVNREMDKFISKRKEIGLEEKDTKKKRRLQQYRSVWERDFPELQHVVGNKYKARCRVCTGIAGGEGFSISHGGITDVRQHFNSASHKERQNSARHATVLKSYFQKNSSESEKVSQHLYCKRWASIIF